MQIFRNMISASARAAFAWCAMLLTLAVVPFLAGCGGGGGGGTTASNTVTGIVRDSRLADQAVGGATVTIGGVSAVTVNVDQANEANPVGSFIMQNVPVGTTTATVRAPGYDQQTIAFSPAITSGTNSPLELIINIGQVSGRILGADGQPASGAFVTVLSTGESVTTAADGTFLITNVPTGETQVSAVFGTAIGSKTVNVGDGVTNAGDIQLADDPDLEFPPSGPATIVGTVTLGNGLGTGSNTTVVLLRDGVQIEQTVSDANGVYSFYVPVGTYSVVAIRPAFQNADSGLVTVSNPSVALSVNLTMTPQ